MINVCDYTPTEAEIEYAASAMKSVGWNDWSNSQLTPVEVARSIRGAIELGTIPPPPHPAALAYARGTAVLLSMKNLPVDTDAVLLEMQRVCRRGVSA